MLGVFVFEKHAGKRRAHARVCMSCVFSVCIRYACVKSEGGRAGTIRLLVCLGKDGRNDEKIKSVGGGPRCQRPTLRMKKPV